MREETGGERRVKLSPVKPLHVSSERVLVRSGSDCGLTVAQIRWIARNSLKAVK